MKLGYFEITCLQFVYNFGIDFHIITWYYVYIRNTETTKKGTVIVMKFSKYNQRKRRRKSGYSREYRQARHDELCRLISDCKTDTERELLIKAYEVSINP